MNGSLEQLEKDLNGPFPLTRLFGNIVFDSNGWRNAFIDPTPVDREALMNFLLTARDHKRTVAEMLFPDNAKGRVRATQDWLNYGWNLWTAIHIKEEGASEPGETVEKYLAIALRIRQEQLKAWPFAHRNVPAENDYCQKKLSEWLAAEEAFGAPAPERSLVKICTACNQLCKESWRYDVNSPEGRENPIIGVGCPALYLFSLANHNRRNPKVKGLEAADYLYKTLQAGDANVFPFIDQELKKRHVAGEYKVTRAGGRIYRIPKSQLDKLPQADNIDNGQVEPFLPVREDEGYGLYPMPDIDDFSIEICAWDAIWQKV